MKATPFHRESLRALVLQTLPARSGGQGARRKMSLVVAFRLAGGDLLFAADKRIVVKSENDVVVRRSSSATKLHAISGGVVAYAGNASLAQDLLLDLVLDEDAKTDRMKQLIRLLRERFSRLASCHSDDDPCELLASDRERLFRLKSPHFDPMLAGGDYEANVSSRSRSDAHRGTAACGFANHRHGRDRSDQRERGDGYVAPASWERCARCAGRCFICTRMGR